MARLARRVSCYILDRAKDMLIRAGENIYCAQVRTRYMSTRRSWTRAFVTDPTRTLEKKVDRRDLKRGATAASRSSRNSWRKRLAAFKVRRGILFWRSRAAQCERKILKTS